MSDSKKNKETKNTEENREKVVTKYDRKVQQRKEQKAREARNKKISGIAGILIVVALVALIASFPIRTYLTVNGTYVTIGGEKVSRVEYDYNFNVLLNNYLSANSTWLSYIGIDLTGDLSIQMYSEDMSWKDYFDEKTVESIAQNMALIREAEAQGFVYDETEEYKEYTQLLKQYASEVGVSTKVYIQQMYGPYATESRVRPFVKENMYANAFYADVAEKLLPSQEEIRQHYNENTMDYDSVDYRVSTVNAVLPTEPTELADPVETPAPAEGEEGTDSTQSAYEPSEAEIAAAMAVARSEAEELEKKIKTEGEQVTNLLYERANYLLSDWLFAEERKPGDTTIIEDATYHRYYVIAFEKRYLDETPTANIRVIMTADGNGQDILDEWKNGAATEESFAELCDKYNDPAVMSSEGGLLEGVYASGLGDELREWIFDSERVGGDVGLIVPETGNYAYVIYYVEPYRALWELQIQSQLQSEKVDEYLDRISSSIEVEDKKGNLNYLKVYAAREEAEAQMTPEPEGE